MFHNQNFISRFDVLLLNWHISPCLLPDLFLARWLEVLRELLQATPCLRSLLRGVGGGGGLLGDLALDLAASREPA